MTSVNSKLEHTSAQCARVQAEEIRSTIGTFNAPSCLLQRLHYVVTFDFTESLNGERLLFCRQFKTIDQLQDAAFRVDNCTLDHIRQLPYVSRPRMTLQHMQRLRRNRSDGLAKLLRVSIDEMLNKKRDVLLTLS